MSLAAQEDMVMESLSQQRCFQYSELQPNTIRIFELFAATQNEPITGRLRCIQLGATHEPYQAISYAWGDSTVRATILCDGHVLHVTQNLHMTLSRLRQADTNMILWIDGICINQGTDDIALRERASQIALMNIIFSSAFRVIVDLGHVDYNFDHVLVRLERYANIVETPTKHAIEGDLSLFSNGESDLHDLLCWQQFHRLISLPWFQRLWCFQEFVLARRVVTLVGNRLVTEFDLHLGITRASGRFEKALVELDTSSISSEFMTNAKTIRHIGPSLHRKQTLRDLQQADKDAGMNLSLDATFTVSRYLEVSDSRDKIYAIYALLPSTITEDFPADFHEDNSSLRQRYSRKLIEKGFGLRTLIFAVGPNAQEPSWTISLSLDEQIYWRQDKFAESSGSMMNFEGRFEDPIFFSAGGSDPCEIKMGPGTGRICVRGCLMDHVVSLSAKISPPLLEDVGQSIATLFDEIAQLLRWAETEKIPVDTIWRLLMFDGYGEVRSAARFRTSESREQYYGTSFRSLKQLLQSGEFLQEGALASRVFLQQVWACMPNLRIAKTAKGCVAAVPHITKPGDPIAVLSGAPTPFVFRNTTSEYKLVGACYLHGFMDGEAVNHREWKPELLTIT